jgi:PAS domain S-box-containing protein
VGIAHEFARVFGGVPVRHALDIFWGWGLVSAALSIVQEGKGQKRAELQQAVKLQSVLQSLPEALFLFDNQGRIIDLNQPAEQLVGVAREELLGHPAKVLSDRVNAGDTEETAVERALRGDHVRHERRVFRTGKAGELREMLISASPMCDMGGGIVGALLVLQDITELTALQRQVESSERHFAVGQMTAGLAHDFNNVLNTISEAVYVLETHNNRSEHDRSMLGIIESAVRRGSEMVGNLREYLRGNRIARERLDMRRLIEEVLQLAQPLLETHPSIQVVRQLEEVPAVEANPAELRRVFVNLVRNALEAMPQGGTLTLRCNRTDDRVATSVADNGTGIPLDEQKMIFSPYYTTKSKGTGLGLAEARRAVQAHGGQIRFESSPGAGTTFHVLLPIANAGAKPLPAGRAA